MCTTPFDASLSAAVTVLKSLPSGLTNTPRKFVNVQVLALNCWNTLEVFQIFGWDLLSKDMVCKDVHKLILVLRLEQGVHGACWQLAKAFIGWGKDCERTWRGQGFCKISCNYSCNQSGEVIHGLRKLHNVRFVITEAAWGQQYTVPC